MRRVRLGDVEIGTVVFGTMAHGPSRIVEDVETRVRVLHAAFDAGIDAVDTAPLYELGGAEGVVGRAIRGRDVRVLTKVGLRWDDPHGDVLFGFPDGTQVRKNSRPESIRWEVEQSLVRLGVDTLDVVQIHHHDPHVPVAESFGALLDLRAEGKLRAAGVCNFSVDALSAVESPLASVQDRYSLLDRDLERTVLPWTREREVPVLAYGTLAEGALVGRRRLAFDDPRRDSLRFSRRNFAKVTDRLDASVRPVAHRHGATVAQIAIAWALGSVDVAIVGASTEQQAKLNAGAGRIDLTETQRAHVGATFTGLELEPASPPRRVERLVRKVHRRFAR